MTSVAVPGIEPPTRTALQIPPMRRPYQRSDQLWGARNGSSMFEMVELGALMDDITDGVVAQAIYYTATDLQAADIGPAITAARTLGRLAIGDHGGAEWVRAASQAAAGPGALRSADRRLPNGTIDLVHGGWWRLASFELTPQMIGAMPDTDCTQAFRLLGQVLQWRGGGVVRAAGWGTFDVWPTATPAGYEALIALSGVPVHIDMGQTRIRSTGNWYSAPGARRGAVVECRGCEGVIIRMRLHQITWTHDEPERGIVAVALVNYNRDITTHIRQVGGSFGVWALRGVDWAGVHTRDLNVDIDTEGVFYPLACSRNGRVIRGKVRTRGAGRSLFLGGVDDVDLDLWTDNWDEFADIKIVAYVDGGPAEEFESGRINVRVTHRPAVTVTEPLAALVGVEIQVLGGAPAGAAARLPNIHIDLDCDYRSNPGAAPNSIYEAFIGTDGVGVITPAAHEVNGLEGSGSVRGINRAGVRMTTLWESGAEGFGPGSVVAGHRFEGITRGDDGADFQVAWYANLAVLTTPLVLRDIHAPRDVLTLAGNAPGKLRLDNAIFRMGGDRDIAGRPLTLRLPDGTQAAALQVISSGWFAAEYQRSDASGNGAALRLIKSRGTPDAPAPPASGDYIATLIGALWDGSTWNTAARFQSRITRYGGVNDFDIGWELETRLGGTRTVTLSVSPQGRYGFGGVSDPACTIDASGPIRTRPVTVAALPAASTCAGASAWVSDATLTYTGANIGTAVTGGGTNGVPVRSNGTAWIIG
jgi:hypothetical protein